MTVLLAVSTVLIVVALGILAVSLVTLSADLSRTASFAAESAARLGETIDAIRGEGENIRKGLTSLSGVVSESPRAAVLVVEAGLLVRNIRMLGTTAAFLTSLRKLLR